MKIGDVVTVIHRRAGIAGLLVGTAEIRKAFKDGTFLAHVHGGGLLRLHPEDQNMSWMTGKDQYAYDALDAARRLLA